MVVRPSLRRPASKSACLTHSRTAVSVRSSSLATWPAVLPVARISSTTSALYSGGKNRRGRGTWTPISRAGPSSWVSTKPGQLHWQILGKGPGIVVDGPNGGAIIPSALDYSHLRCSALLGRCRVEHGPPRWSSSRCGERRVGTLVWAQRGERAVAARVVTGGQALDDLDGVGIELSPVKGLGYRLRAVGTARRLAQAVSVRQPLVPRGADAPPKARMPSSQQTRCDNAWESLRSLTAAARLDRP